MIHHFTEESLFNTLSEIYNDYCKQEGCIPDVTPTSDFWRKPECITTVQNLMISQRVKCKHSSWLISLTHDEMSVFVEVISRLCDNPDRFRVLTLFRYIRNLYVYDHEYKFIDDAFYAVRQAYFEEVDLSDSHKTPYLESLWHKLKDYKKYNEEAKHVC